MRPRASTSLELCAAALGVAAFWARPAAAQPCCAGASAVTPARLALHEDAVAGVQLRATDVVGSFDAGRRYVAAPPGAHEVDLEEDLVATVRFAKRAQASAQLPVDETYRAAGGQSEWGGGFGDVGLALRYDFLEAGMSRTIPGVAVLLAVTLPTGRPVEATSTPLATGATGIGAYQGALGLAVEQSWGGFYASALASLAGRTPRTVGAVHETDGVLFVVNAAAAYAFSAGPVVALSLAYDGQLAGSIDGETVKSGGRAFTRGALGLGYPFSNALRGQLSVFGDVPLRGFGQNQPTGFGASFVFLRSWS